ncbi:autophagy-related protein 2 [Geosmithia morbida]|uniref:Autophagy-related protein 2 n=1 Tax=Geosmithia morbida TaxID=1094350 RepID=A0A9P4YWS2_9HYPO|nr:autophagy-related protein 2 [Geosmithia morbida]KAF4124290.1 autophagy-related protein 2 [Geosmithia morbida]
MATLFRSFRSSSMPKRLLRYALARLDLLDADALDMDNLDLAIGRNSVFEFRDVGVKLKKLEKLLKLPPTLRLRRAKVILLRITVPVDIYTSPIIIDVDGVDVRLQVLDTERKPAATTGDPGTQAPHRHDIVPNTVDLAQSFLDSQPSSERKQLEDALVAETQDLGASVSMSDDGSVEDEPLGTGQPLSLPSFLADFLQGVVDRTQINICSVTFQLEANVPVDPASSNPEPVSFQVSLERIDVQGVTTQDAASPAIVPKEGKRHISLKNVRAYLVLEASVLSALARSPSTASPSLASSPAMTRNPPTREGSGVEQVSPLQPSGTLPSAPQGSVGTLPLDDGREDDDASSGSEGSLEDSEEALGIPYDDMSEGDLHDDDGPPTPRASIYHGFDASPEASMFHSTMAVADSALLDTHPPLWASAQSGSASEQSEGARLSGSRESGATLAGARDDEPASPAANATAFDDASDSSNEDDLTRSHLYTHEEAESMYLSAFSSGSSGEHPRSPELQRPASLIDIAQPTTTPPGPPDDAPRSVMPGGWGEESVVEDGPVASPTPKPATVEDRTISPEPVGDRPNDEESLKGIELDDAATPKGPARLVKEFLSLDNISIYVPTHHHHVHAETSSAESVANLDRSAYPQAPGAFSIHGSAPRDTRHRPASTYQPPADDDADNALEVDLSPISIRFDASLGFLLAVITGRLSEAVKPKPDPTAESGPQAPKVPTAAPSAPPPELKLNLQEISIDFVNQLGGVADTIERYMGPSVFNFDNDVLLNATLQNLTASVSYPSPASKTREAKSSSQDVVPTIKLELEKFRFGHANDDIISFDKARPMSTSVRDTFLSSGHDVAINMVQSNGDVRIDVETLPIAIQIDLQRLDETFGWFGGLSSFLNMSTSMASVHSSTVKQSSPAKPKPRGVRFEAPVEPNNKTAASESKISLRLGGSYVELRGKDCSVSAESSAIKLISRDEVLGVAISFLRLSGPHIRNSMADPAITTEASGIRLDFHTTPKDADLERLLELITPSSAKFDGDNDEIMVDTLLRQRRKGSVLRVGVDAVATRVKNLAQLSILPAFGDDIAKLSTVAKYLPEDDRPGLLTLARIQKTTAQVDCGGGIGVLDLALDQLEAAHITVPSLLAVAACGLSLHRNGEEELVRSSAQFSGQGASRVPVMMARMIGDDIEPVIKLKLQHVAVEYRVPFIMDLLGLGDDATPQDFESGLAASVASLGDQAQATLAQSSRQQPADPSSKPKKPMTLDVGFGDCLIGLNPLGRTSKMTISLTESRLQVVLPKEDALRATLAINKASILLIDDVGQLVPPDHRRAMSHRRSASIASKQVADLRVQGYVDICYISSATVVVSVDPGPDGEKQVQVDVRDDLLVLETCADSTQTLISLANALKPPTPPSKEIKYRTNVMPMEDLLASISAEAFGRPEGEYDFDQDFAGAQEMAGSGSDIGYGNDSPLRVDSRYYNEHGVDGEEMFDAMKSSGISSDGTASMQDTDEGVLLSGTQASLNDAAVTADDDSDGGGLEIHEGFFAAESSPDSGHPTAKTWNSKKNTYDRAPEKLVRRSPLKVTVRDTHFIWNLFDGYDWVQTRDVIGKAVHDIEHKALERQARAEGSSNVYEEELEDEEAIGDFLFNSIYIGVPANRDPRELSRAINDNLNDNATETESVATTAFTGVTATRAGRAHQKSKRLKLNRSRHHKITFELQGINADLFAYAPGADNTESSLDVRVQNVDVFDHVPSSTWKKFATYDRDAGEREMGAPMLHLEMLNVRPLSDLPVSEIVLRTTLLPVRLHVDQDALDFITRFFEFKDGSVPVHSSPSDVPFIQRAEVMSVPVKLDFKPKRVDYAGLRSGHTSEFMNFIVLENANMVLRHAIIYGISGFDRLGKTLNDLWTPDVTRNQLPGVIAGLAPVRSLVTIGSGIKDLVEIPIREYHKDGRVVRSISKGAAAFARTTGTEIVKLGAKLAVGTQYALQGAEEMLTENGRRQDQAVDVGGWDGSDAEEDWEPEERKQISLYADPPPSVLQGLRGGYRSLTRDVNLARDAIIAVPGEVMQSRSPGGAAKAVWKRAPTIVFRPAVGVTKVVGQTLMGVTSAIDPQHRRRVDEKYKKH